MRLGSPWALTWWASGGLKMELELARQTVREIITMVLYRILVLLLVLIGQTKEYSIKPWSLTEIMIGSLYRFCLKIAEFAI